MKIDRNWRNIKEPSFWDKHDEKYSSVCQCDDCRKRRLGRCGWMVHVCMHKEHGDMEISGFGKEHFFKAGCMKPVCKSNGVVDDFNSDRYDMPKDDSNICKRCLCQMTTMGRLYGDIEEDEHDKHITCRECGMCISCGDCNTYGCGSRYRNGEMEGVE